MAFTEKYDKPIYGIVTGLILPPIGFFLSYLVKFYPRPFAYYFWEYFMVKGYEQTQIFTFSMLPSLFLFYFILFRWKMEVAGKTFVGVSLIYVIFYMYKSFL